ncbi:Uu.00g094080.m01.CDS01 [Anthostomella pinea]|uniref:aminodeoxychorismate synthase n=1 Tax=Anthostomella pinea TaxID=933095 RepID=A0AAI8YKM9_9PEZI|nr:Uu.00g094080.m01.CDS01 [Anthostomella pinea]
MDSPRILFIDAYDSFSNNIVSLLTTVLDAEVDILPIDPPHLNPKNPSFKDDLSSELRRYDAVVCGPGPGSPGVDQDVGLMKHVWDLGAKDMVPILGICLGFQSLVVSCGGLVKKLRTGLHGMIRAIDHLNEGSSQQDGNIFYGVPPFKATLYHSLHADIGQESILAENWTESRWKSLAHLPDIVPLAWTYEDRGDVTERILMGLKHRRKPSWGLQYHPESICTESTGHQVIRNWFDAALRWNREAGRKTDRSPSQFDGTKKMRRISIWDIDEGNTALKQSVDNFRIWADGGSQLATFGLNANHMSRVLNLPEHIEVPDLVEMIQGAGREYIILDSASAKAGKIGDDVRGRYSIIALDVDGALKLEYRTGNRHVTARLSRTAAPSPQTVSETIKLGAHQTIWQLLSEFWTRRKTQGEDYAPTPFLGGFMGYCTYELGLEGIDVKLREQRRHERPDLCFAWVTKSLIVDHLDATVRIQCLSQSESMAQTWLNSVAEGLLGSSMWSQGLRREATQNLDIDEPTPPRTPTTEPTKTQIQIPDADEYEAKVRLCQDYIASGDSYELCLTDQTLITRPRSPQTTDSISPASSSSSSSWTLYRTLRATQPAPFGSYLRLGGATLISSSPERFLEYDAAGLCSMRPMKGTVRKSASSLGGVSEGVSTLAQAERILHVPKEEAENLMIVDLVRHDLHGVCGPGRVAVPRLLVVEEYASVFQMVSVVEGRLPLPQFSTTTTTTPAESSDSGGSGERQQQLTGLDVLAASLPPGSMTGAPKKRSCEILQEVEVGGPHTHTRERSLYSGVVGYMDVTGRGDWSVTIRSLLRWDDEEVVYIPVPRNAHAGCGDNGVEGQDGDRSKDENGVGDRSGKGHRQRQELEVWHIGAGGAVTALSTPEGEREEMFTKLKGPLGVFERF